MIFPAFTKTYGDGFVLHMPRLEPERGKLWAVVGANGSGKSTFSKVMAGVLPADGGTLAAAECSVGYLPQKSYPFRLPVERSMALTGGDETRVVEMMEALSIGHLAGRRAHRLSGGESARLALGRVLLGQYDLLILDEPTAAMDMESTLAAEELITRSCREEERAVVLITHSLPQAARLADEVLFLHGGELWERGPELLCAPQRPETARFVAFSGSL